MFLKRWLSTAYSKKLRTQQSHSIKFLIVRTLEFADLLVDFRVSVFGATPKCSWRKGGIFGKSLFANSDDHLPPSHTNSKWSLLLDQRVGYLTVYEIRWSFKISSQGMMTSSQIDRSIFDVVNQS
jgi:hypothetical protein